MDEDNALIVLLDRWDSLHKMDNRQLAWMLWILTSEKEYSQMEEDVYSEIVSRLYPEYDGDKIVVTNYGWKTPEGEIRYIGKKEKKKGENK